MYHEILQSMTENRFPTSGLSAEYGAVVMDAVTHPVTLVVTHSSVEIVRETYYPDTNAQVMVYDLGLLAMMYKNKVDLSTTYGIDGARVELVVSLTEASTVPQTISKTVTIYQCDVETSGTIDSTLLLKMPLTRVTKKTTGPGRHEFISFFGSSSIKAYVVKKGTLQDEAVNVYMWEVVAETGELYRVDVSPSEIATHAGCTIDDILYYNVYTSKDAIIRYTMDHRTYPHKKTFLFRNCFGAQEAFTAIGNEQSERKWTRQFGAVKKKQTQISRDLEHKHIVNTGYITRQALESLEDMMNSDMVCLYDEFGMHDIIISEESFKVTDRRDELTAIEFTYKIASNNQLQTRYKPFVKPGVFDKTFDTTFN